MSWKGLIHRWRRFLPVGPRTPVVTLLEGQTNLVPAPRLAAAIHPNLELHLKVEGQNPTGSFKDRGMTLAVSKAAEAGSRAVLCASTGNTAASAAAYASRAGMRCVVLIPRGNIALGKLAQALMHGAEVLAIEGNFDQALQMARQLCQRHPITLVNSLNPFRLEGQKTGAFEIVEQLGGKAPDYQAMPVGNAGNISAYWKGYQEARAAGLIRRLPMMLGFQAAGAAPIVRGRSVAKPQTVATAIRIGNPASWKLALQARDESGGLIEAVRDDQILQAYRWVAELEGIFCEPASAAGLAGLYKLARRGFFKGRKKVRVAAVLTGHGLKDPEAAIAQSPRPRSLRPNLRDLERFLKF